MWEGFQKEAAKYCFSPLIFNSEMPNRCQNKEWWSGQQASPGKGSGFRSLGTVYPSHPALLCLARQLGWSCKLSEGANCCLALSQLLALAFFFHPLSLFYLSV